MKFTVSDKTTTEGHFDLYNEITYTPRSSCVRTESHSIVKDTKSYQDELSAGVSLGGNEKNQFSQVADWLKVQTK